MRSRLNRVAIRLAVGMFVIAAPLWAVADEVDLDHIFAGDAPQNPAELKAMQDHIRELSERVITCTVGVRAGAAQGSGVIISADGYVLTAAHVAGRANRNLTIVMPDGREVRARSLGLNRRMDAGLIKITEGDEESDESDEKSDESDESKKSDDEPIEWPFAEMGDSSKLRAGQWCIATGHPGGYQIGRPPVVRLGRVLRPSGSVLNTDCTLVGGDSGGPLFDMQGNVIGIHSRIGQSLTANFHVPVSTYRDSWDRLAAGDVWGTTPIPQPRRGGTPIIGVRGPANGDEARITYVFPDMPAEQAGIKAGDVITSYNGQKVTSFESLTKLVAASRRGRPIKIEVLREDSTVELELRFPRPNRNNN